MKVTLKEFIVTSVVCDYESDRYEEFGDYEKAEFEVDDNILLECYREYKEDKDLDILDLYSDYDLDEFFELYNDYLLGKGVRVIDE